MDIEENERAFLIGLEKLTRETGVAIGGCGCCGSPYLMQVSGDELAPGAGYGFGRSAHVLWISPSNDYDWENFAESIVVK